MKKLLFVNGHLNTGGCERSLVDLLNNLDFDKYSVDLLLLEDKGDYLTELNSNVNVCYHPINNAFGSFKYVLINAIKTKNISFLRFRITYYLSCKFRKTRLKKTKFFFNKLQDSYDVAIAYRPGICTDLVANTFSAKLKMSWWHHGGFNYIGNSKMELIDSFSKMDKIGVVSQSCIEMLNEYLPELKDKYILIPNMLRIDDILSKSKEYLDRKENNKVEFVSVGRLSEEKNMIMCPMIAKKLKEQGVSFNWNIVGDGNKYSTIKEYINENNLKDCVHLLGAKSNPYPYISNADLFVHPSKVESQGIAILEAMALNVPVVVAESLGPKEFIDGENGILTECTVEAMTKAILDLINNDEKYNNLKENTRLPKQFLPENVMEKFYKTIRE